MQVVTRMVSPLTGRCGPWLGAALRAVLAIALACPSARAADATGAKDSSGSGTAVTSSGSPSNPVTHLPGRGGILEEFGTSTQPAAEVVPNSSVASGMPTAAQDRQVIQRRSASETVPRGAEAQYPVQRPVRGLGSWSIWDSLPLLVVLILIGGVALVIKRSMPVRRMLAGGGVLVVLARLPISAKQSLMLVKMGRQLVLLGVTPDRISSLSVVTDPEQVTSMVGDVASGNKDSMTRAFAEAFSDESKAYAGAEEDEPAVPSASGQVKNLLEKVRSLAKGQGAF